MLTVVILAWSSSKISYQSNVCGKCHEKSKFMKGWRSYYGELLWGLLESTGAALARLHQHPTRTDAATPLTCIHATFFFCWVLIRAGLWRTGPILAEMADTAPFRPKRAATMSPASILLLHGALCVREKERDKGVCFMCTYLKLWQRVQGRKLRCG